jgi:hypothetical protein
VKPYRYDISLRVRHPSMDPAEISTALALEPSRMWRAGEQRMTPKDTPLEGTWRDTYWYADVFKDECPDRTLAAALSELVERFSSKKSAFAKIRDDGGQVEFYVGWYIDGNRGDKFDTVLLAKLADLGVNLSLDIYPPPNPQDNF